MRAATVQWDLSSMGPEELLSEGTIFFLAKVLAAASVVAFGPALVLEYVPTSKVDVRDVSSAGSHAGRDPTRELLEYSSASVEDEGSAAGAMLASAYMSQTPEKRVSTASSESCRPGAPEVVELFPAVAPSSDSAVAAPSSPELTLYGNPKDAATGQEGPPADAAVSKGHAVLVRGGGGDAACSKGDHHHEHHDHGPADAGAYVTLAVDFLHNLIDGIGIGAAYAVGGDAVGHATAALKLVHEVQHEIGDVATLVQCGMSKHHAIHIQHTTAAGVFLGVAISLGAGAFPEGLLAACLALSAGATFHLASGPVLGPVLAIPADVGGPVQGLLEVAALAAGAAGVVAIGLAEGWAGIGH
ncbi:unnamed protein product [Ectocarpus sp. 12 AP-2014]